MCILYYTISIYTTVVCLRDNEQQTDKTDLVRYYTAFRTSSFHIYLLYLRTMHDNIRIIVFDHIYYYR